MASSPVPIKPTVYSNAAKRPARGFNASAAWREVSMFVMPCRWSTRAVVRMMKNMTRFEKNVPTPTSSLRVASSLEVAPVRRMSMRRPIAFSSSTS